MRIKEIKSFNQVDLNMEAICLLSKFLEGPQVLRKAQIIEIPRIMRN